jgi:hypothetical protein
MYGLDVYGLDVHGLNASLLELRAQSLGILAFGEGTHLKIDGRCIRKL